MWHGRKRHRLGVKTQHRKALLRNLVRGLALNRRIMTTLARAKETSRLADKMVTLAKKGTLAARRQLIRHLASPEVAHILMEEVAPHFKERNGGYTRVLKCHDRPGDGALAALVEFTVPIARPEKKTRKAKKAKKPEPEKKEAEKKEAKRQEAEKKEEKRQTEKQEAEKKAVKDTKEKTGPAKESDKEETEKRGGFLSKLRKFLKGD
ncbi:MAG: 50S ribosomal protein L17 [Candidatus Omnitrophica bacterium]|nr:50S ribosomal protein L17 [Candidatus Omnitrophota bacterium]